MFSNLSIKKCFLLLILLSFNVLCFAKSPEDILSEMRNLDISSITTQEYYDKVLNYYDIESKSIFKEYLLDMASAYNLSLDEFYQLIDSTKELLDNMGFVDIMSSYLKKSKDWDSGLSDYKLTTEYDGNEALVIESFNIDIDKFVRYLLKNSNSMLNMFNDEEDNDDESEEIYETMVVSMKIGIENSFPPGMYVDGKITKTTHFVKKNWLWKIHLSGDDIDLMYNN